MKYSENESLPLFWISIWLMCSKIWMIFGYLVSDVKSSSNKVWIWLLHYQSKSIKVAVSKTSHILFFIFCSYFHIGIFLTLLRWLRTLSGSIGDLSSPLISYSLTTFKVLTICYYFLRYSWISPGFALIAMSSEIWASSFPSRQFLNSSSLLIRVGRGPSDRNSIGSWVAKSHFCFR